ncbi:MAG TPA: ABC transporter permease [Streptosporangiaceae bacterium]|jgi:peptide/nickel transport system permease protein|nr:ABC transporter permease [Streptosporangiaceae bacterium]
MRMIARRIAFYLLTAIVAITVNFFLPRLMPGNPVLAVLGRVQAEETRQAIAALELQYGVQTKTGLWGQYIQYWDHLLHGNLGTSLSAYPASVGGLIRAALPWTIGLVGIATVISFVLGTLLGVAAAWRRGSWLDGLLPAMTFFQAAPYFFVAILAVALFATKLGWFPPNSGYDATTLNPGLDWPFISNMIDHAVLPAVTIVLASIAGWIIGMRNMMITTMDEDYVLLAQAKGLPSHRVISYAARNALLPSVAGFSLAIGFIVSGALLTEIVFSYPGVGYLLFTAIGSDDYPLLQGIFLIITLAVLLANLAADFVYAFLDPRTRQEA